MAVVIPYGDAQAHGSLADSISFRRHRGRVILQKKPHSRVPGTPGQLAQRQRFKDGWTSYHALNLWELQYVQTKATAAQTSPSAWYLSQYLTDNIPSTTVQKGIKQITDLDLPEVIGTDPLEIQFLFNARTDPATDIELANIWDNQNLITPGPVVSPYDRAYIRVYYPGVSQVVIPFDYPILIYWNNFSDEPKENLIRLPELHLAPTPSTDFFPDCKNIVWITNLEASAPGGGQVDQQYWFEYPTSPFENPYNIDPFNCNVGFQLNVSPNHAPANYNAFRITFTSHFAGTWSIPDNWTVQLEYNDFAAGTLELFIRFPALTLLNGESKTYWMSADTSLWNDQAMTSLAKYNGPQEINLWLAQDFSLYYNQELTQLANSPYF